MNEKQLNFEIMKLRKENEELKVLIDTLQTNLRSAVSCLNEKDKDSITKVQSYKWCSSWKPQQVS